MVDSGDIVADDVTIWVDTPGPIASTRVRRLYAPVGTVDIVVADAEVTIQDDTIRTMFVEYRRRARR